MVAEDFQNAGCMVFYCPSYDQHRRIMWLVGGPPNGGETYEIPRKKTSQLAYVEVWDLCLFIPDHWITGWWENRLFLQRQKKHQTIVMGKRVEFEKKKKDLTTWLYIGSTPHLGCQSPPGIFNV